MGFILLSEDVLLIVEFINLEFFIFIYVFSKVILLFLWNIFLNKLNFYVELVIECLMRFYKE